jgi:hypothetical protein
MVVALGGHSRIGFGMVKITVKRGVLCNFIYCKVGGSVSQAMMSSRCIPVRSRSPVIGPSFVSRPDGASTPQPTKPDCVSVFPPDIALLHSTLILGDFHDIRIWTELLRDQQNAGRQPLLDPYG